LGRASPPAVLNFGDLFALALACLFDVPLLFRSGDFTVTDVKPAAQVPSPATLGLAQRCWTVQKEGHGRTPASSCPGLGARTASEIRTAALRGRLAPQRP
jgi:hypothetical protein